MKFIFTVYIAIFISAYGMAQNCNLSSLSHKQKMELSQFWQDIRNAVNNKNKAQLAKLCYFPFNCSFCESNHTQKPYLTIDKRKFYQRQYKIFFSDYFKETITKYEIFTLLKGTLLDDGSCSYSFGFPIVKPSKTTEGIEGSVTIKEIKGQYLISSVWSVP